MEQKYLDDNEFNKTIKSLRESRDIKIAPKRKTTEGQQSKRRKIQ